MSDSNPGEIDYVIIGQGLAGSVLAWQLHRLGKDVLIFDNSHHMASSTVASGLLNPVTGQRLHADEKVHEYLRCSAEIYRDMATDLSQALFYPLPMRRFAGNTKDKERYHTRRQQALYDTLIGDWCAPDNNSLLNDEYGSFEQYYCGRLDIPALLSAVKRDFVKRQRYCQQNVSYPDIRVKENNIQVHHICCRHLIFCQGHQAQDNPWFPDPVWNISRGDILHFQSDVVYPFIANYGYNYIPVAEHDFHWGSSFDPHPAQTQATFKGLQQLIAALKTFDKNTEKNTLIAQYSGLRPASRDKRPLIGFHSKQANVAIFNGFGARGSLLIPYYARHFCRVLLQQENLQGDIDYQRFTRQV